MGSGSLPQVLLKLFQKLAGCRDGVPAKGFGERSSPINKDNGLIPRGIRLFFEETDVACALCIDAGQVFFWMK